MKTLYTIITTIFLMVNTFAQAPEKMSYQAVVRDEAGALVSNQLIGMQISILQGGALGTAVYMETQTPTTNNNGLVTLEIGTGSVVSGNFTTIDWSSNTYFIKTETDPTGGSSYSISGTSQLLSVPYALHATTAANTFSGNYEDLTNLPTLPTVKTYSIGDEVFGGVVFWVDETGQHGLVCAKQNQDAGAGVRWYAGTNGSTQAKGYGPYSGKANTTIIIAAQVAIGDDGAIYAARICNELEVTDALSGKVYGDWYLPSIAEVSKMFDNKTTLEAVSGFSPFGVMYWSSTEASANTASVRNFSNSMYADVSKSSELYVRAVRAF